MRRMDSGHAGLRCGENRDDDDNYEEGNGLMNAWAVVGQLSCHDLIGGWSP